MKILAPLLLIPLLSPFNALAQETCPFGLEADPAPGACARYIDENADAFCDLSEVPLAVRSSGSAVKAPAVSEKELKQRTVAEVAGLYGIAAERYAAVLGDFLGTSVRPGDSLQALHDRNGLCAGVAGALALDLKSNPSEPAVAKAQAAVTAGLPRYQLVWIALSLLALHTLTWLLAKTKKIKLLCHRRIWNSLLLLSFLASAALGLLLIVRINWGWAPALPFNMLYWHVETATAMAFISFLHLVAHWRYYYIIIKVNGSAESGK